MTKRLLEPILEGGIRHVHFFNGRRLTAEDLQAEQAANREERARLGLAAGAGIVWGLEVSETADASPADGGRAAVLKVRAGLAINGLGQAVALPYDQRVALVAPEAPLPASAGLFGPCEGAAPVEIGTGSGAYILVLTPVSGFEGRAPMSGPDAGGRVTGCGSRYSVAGVRFGVVPVPLPGGPGDPATLRNRLAHLCFGTEALLEGRRVPPEGPGGDGLAGAAPDLSPCDVPLALLYWSGGSVRFLDMWSVRRRVTAPYPAPRWLAYVADGRRAVAEAIFLQFQDEIDQLVQRETGLKRMDAASRFRYLPAAGFLPVGHNEFDVYAFFREDRFRRRIELEADPAYLRVLLMVALYVDPIDVNDPPPVAIYHIPGVEDYIFFMRQEASRLSDRKAPEVVRQTEESKPEPTGTIEVDLAVADESAQTALIRELRGLSSKGASAAGTVLARSFKVTAVDELGNVYEGQTVLDAAAVKLAEDGKRFARSVIDGLDPGVYTVKVQAKLFRAASKLVKLGSGGRERVLFQLVPLEERSGGQPAVAVAPGKVARADWMEHAWYDKIAVMDAYINPNPLPQSVRQWDLVTDPPPEVREWLIAWADAVAARLPSAAVDPGDVRIVVRPDYVPGTVADEPYAYIEFGENGAHVPVVLVPNHMALDGPVAVQSAEVAGIDQDIGMRLWQLGAGEVDIAASAWTGLLVDAGLAQETAASVLEEARRKVTELKTSVKVVPGVDTKLGASLQEKGIDSAVKLANADPVKLQEELGIDSLAANVVVEEARRIVPEEVWSLRSPDLGLSDAQVKALEEIGIKTKGDLAAKPVEEISEKMEVDAGEAGSIVERAKQALDESRLKLSVQEKAPVTLLKEAERVPMDAALAKNLARSGVKTLKDVAEADADRLAQLTGDRKIAQTLIDAAKARIELVR